MIRAGLLELPFKKVMDHLHALTPNNQRPIWTIQRRVPYPGLSKASKAIPHGLVHLPAIQGIAGGHTHTHKCASSFTKNSVDRVFGVRYGRFRHKCSCLSDASLINTVQPKLVARLPLHHTSPDFVHPWAQTLSIVLGASQGAQPTLARCEFQHHEKLCLIAGILLQLSPS